MRYYLSQITQAQEDERKRIARELHDETTQILYALSRQVDNFLRANSELSREHTVFLNELRRQLNEALGGLNNLLQKHLTEQCFR